MTQVKPEYGLYPYQHQVLDELLAVLNPRQGSVVRSLVANVQRDEAFM